MSRTFQKNILEECHTICKASKQLDAARCSLSKSRTPGCKPASLNPSVVLLAWERTRLKTQSF